MMKSILLPIFSILLCGSKTSFGWTQTSPKLFHLGNQNGQFWPFFDCFFGGYFYFIYCISVFTHLSIDVGKKWLIELNRVVKPGGIILFTTSGEKASQNLTDSDREIYNKEGYLVRSNVKEGMI